jgi:LacI family transcriptional regulator
MGVTIKDIAEKTGVSITSVSLVLNKKENRISEKTKQLIESTALELNYLPNRSAINLATKKNKHDRSRDSRRHVLPLFRHGKTV